MIDIFGRVYKATKKGRIVFFLFVLLVFSVAAYFASQLHFQEDISKAIPSDEKTRQLDFVFNNAKLMDKLLVNVYFKDTNRVDRDGLAKVADEFADTLESLQPQFIKDFYYQFENNAVTEVYDAFYENLPFVLEDKDYRRIDTLVQQEKVNAAIKSAYRTMISPASMVMKKFILKDPLGITPIALDKLQNLKIDESYDMNDGYIYANGGKSLMMFITPANSNNETQQNTLFIQKLDSLISVVESDYNNEVEIEYFGSVAIGVCNANRLKTDIILTVSIALALLLILFSLFFRKIYVFFSIFIPAVFGAAISLAVLYLVKGEISAISLGIGSVLLGITVDYSLHIYTHYRSTGNIFTVLKDVGVPIMK